MSENPRFDFLKKTFANKKEKKKARGVNKILECNSIELKQETYLDIPKSLKSEFHFLKFPFFDLSPRRSKKDKIEIREIEESKEGKIEILWKVSRNIDFDFPSSFARRVHKEVIEKLLNNLKKPIPRLISLGSLYNICKIMNITPTGENLKAIRKALKDISTTSIEAKGTFRTKDKNGSKKFFEGIFHLYDMVFFKGETLPDGTEADAVYILLNDKYVQNFNDNFVVPLDYDYFQSLQGDITSRMYEILSIWFYPALEYNKKHIDKKYSELCDYFPLTRQNSKWKAKGQLKKAHQQHTQSGFLAQTPEWLENGKKDDWIVRYYIGKKAKDWYTKNKKDSLEENRQIKTALPKPENQTPQIHPPEPSTFEDPLTAHLSAIGITKDIAKDLVANYNKDTITYWLKAINDKHPQDKPAFLVSAVKGGWELPEKIKKKKQKTEKQKAQAEYNQFIKTQIDNHLSQMTKKQLAQERKAHEKTFFKKNPIFQTFRKKASVEPYIESDYRAAISKKLALPSFEQWQGNPS